jgi:hypothetical protein
MTAADDHKRSRFEHADKIIKRWQKRYRRRGFGVLSPVGLISEHHGGGQIFRVPGKHSGDRRSAVKDQGGNTKLKERGP